MGEVPADTGTSGCAAVPPSFCVYVTLCVVTYLAEVALCVYAIVDLYLCKELVWFAVAAGLLTVALIASQLLSLHLLTAPTGAAPSTTANRGISSGQVAVHVFLGAIPWRYFRLAVSQRSGLTPRDLRDMYIVRMAHTFSCTLPSLLLHTFLLLRHQSEDGFQPRWPCIMAAGVLLVSGCWTLATFRRGWTFCCVLGSLLPFSAIGVRAVWRTGELLARTMALALFATCHDYWIFLVLGLHEISMVLLLVMDRALKSQTKDGGGKSKTAGVILLVSYLYLFCHLNIRHNKSKIEFILYHIILCLETVTLVILWVIYDKNTSSHLGLVLFVAVSYVTGWLAAITYYACFYRNRPKEEATPDNSVCLFQCLECKLSASGKRHLYSESPYHASLVQIQDNPNPKYFDLLHPSDSETTLQTYTDVSSVGSERPVYFPRGRCGRRQKRAKSRDKQCSLNTDSISGITRTNVASRASEAGSQDVSELAWDNYDLQMTSHPTSASDLPLPPDDDHDNCRAPSTAVQSSANMPSAIPDQGYHSANSSSRDNAQLNAGGLLLQNLLRLPYLTSSATSDDNTSTITSVSSRLDLMNCHKCGYGLSIDSSASSMYSTSTVTSYTPSQPALAHRSCGQTRGRGLRGYGRGARRKVSGRGSYPARRKRTRVMQGGHRSRGRRESDDTSTSAA